MIYGGLGACLYCGLAGLVVCGVSLAGVGVLVFGVVGFAGWLRVFLGRDLVCDKCFGVWGEFGCLLVVVVCSCDLLCVVLGCGVWFVLGCVLLAGFPGCLVFGCFGLVDWFISLVGLVAYAGLLWFAVVCCSLWCCLRSLLRLVC